MNLKFIAIKIHLIPPLNNFMYINIVIALTWRITSVFT
jgi:hypothetical protein